MNKRGFFYRLVVILLVWALFASVVLIAFASVGAMPGWAYGTIFGVLGGILVLAEAGNELAISLRKKRQHENHRG
jgi:di/tricarboxylate transporter